MHGQSLRRHRASGAGRGEGTSSRRYAPVLAAQKGDPSGRLTRVSGSIRSPADRSRDPDLGVHDAAICAFTTPIHAFTMRRSRCSRCRDLRVHDRAVRAQEYLRCLIRLVPMWPEDRMLELAPLFWSRTRARLDPTQLEAEIGWITIPAEPLDTSASAEQPVAS
jgi:hypothetical protein